MRDKEIRGSAEDCAALYAVARNTRPARVTCRTDKQEAASHKCTQVEGEAKGCTWMSSWEQDDNSVSTCSYARCLLRAERFLLT